MIQQSKILLINAYRETSLNGLYGATHNIPVQLGQEFNAREYRVSGIIMSNMISPGNNIASPISYYQIINNLAIAQSTIIGETDSFNLPAGGVKNPGNFDVPNNFEFTPFDIRLSGYSGDVLAVSVQISSFATFKLYDVLRTNLILKFQPLI